MSRAKKPAILVEEAPEPLPDIRLCEAAIAKALFGFVWVRLKNEDALLYMASPDRQRHLDCDVEYAVPNLDVWNWDSPEDREGFAYDWDKEIPKFFTDDFAAERIFLALADNRMRPTLSHDFGQFTLHVSSGYLRQVWACHASRPHAVSETAFRAVKAGLWDAAKKAREENPEPPQKRSPGDAVSVLYSPAVASLLDAFDERLKAESEKVRDRSRAVLRLEHYRLTEEGGYSGEGAWKELIARRYSDNEAERIYFRELFQDAGGCPNPERGEWYDETYARMHDEIERMERETAN